MLGFGFALTVLITLRDYRSDARQGVRMFIALKFPSGVEATQLRLMGCDYTVTDPRKPEAKKNGQVKPIRAGDGWICPVPDVAPGAIVDFVIKDALGRKWIIESQTPELLWPPVDVALGS